MGLLPLVACSIVAAGPAWLVVPGDAEEPSTRAANVVVTTFSKSGRIAVVAGPAHQARQCPERASGEQAACFLQAAPGARVLVINGAALRDRFALTIAVLAKDGSVLEEAADKGALNELEALTAATLTRLERALASREASDAPVAVKLLPADVAPVVLEKAPSSRVPAWIATGATAAVAAVAVTFLVLGLSAKSSLDGAQPGQLRHSEAVALEQQANTDLSVSLGAGIGAGVGGVLSAVLWGSGT